MNVMTTVCCCLIRQSVRLFGKCHVSGPTRIGEMVEIF